MSCLFSATKSREFLRIRKKTTTTEIPTIVATMSSGRVNHADMLFLLVLINGY